MNQQRRRGGGDEQEPDVPPGLGLTVAEYAQLRSTTKEETAVGNGGGARHLRAVATAPRRRRSHHPPDLGQILTRILTLTPFTSVDCADEGTRIWADEQSRSRRRWFLTKVGAEVNGISRDAQPAHQGAVGSLPALTTTSASSPSTVSAPSPLTSPR
ncbi:hypothetical protein E2562_027430 [Oryza meyeriana var. granulata]|uniref:Uncharacterized protein n=1 Tax=Oryza meyeriana var. granulata TaxID=110450 RepID=A0A6G1EQD5_9ORYZ|nr:hypothetical protein E2562_027430 [Oryza meyeriana var. granulata]